MYHIIFVLLFTVYIITNTGRYIAFDADWKCTCVVAILPVTLGRRRGEEVGSIAKKGQKLGPEEKQNHHLEGRGVMAESGCKLRRLILQLNY